MKLKKTFVSIILLVALCMSVLYGCGSGEPGPDSTASTGVAPKEKQKEQAIKAPSDNTDSNNSEPEKVTIRIASWYPEVYLGNLKSYLNRSFPEVTFEYIYIDRNHYESIIDSQLSYRGAPDIIYVDQGMAKKHALTRYITPLTDITENFDDDGKRAFMYGTEVYAVPNTSCFKCIYYNKNLFEKYGLQEAHTYQDFLDNAVYIEETVGKNVLSASFKDYATISESAQAFLQASYFSTDKGSSFGARLSFGRATFYKDLYEYFQDWEKLITYNVFRPEMYNMDQKAAIDEFVTEESFMLVGGPEDYNRIKVLRPDMDLGTMPFCGTEDGFPVLIGGCDCGFAVSTYGKQRELAIEIVASLATPEGQTEVWKDRVGSESYLKDFVITNPKTFDGITYAMEHKGMFLPYYTWGEDSDNINMIFGKELQKVLLGKQPTNMALMQVDIKVNKNLRGK